MLQIILPRFSSNLLIHIRLYNCLTEKTWYKYYLIVLQGEFTDEGTETHFEIGAHSAKIKGYTTGKRREGIQHKLFVDEVEIPEAKE
jgi:hypothetical protein